MWGQFKERGCDAIYYVDEGKVEPSELNAVKDVAVMFREEHGEMIYASTYSDSVKNQTKAERKVTCPGLLPYIYRRRGRALREAWRRVHFG